MLWNFTFSLRAKCRSCLTVSPDRWISDVRFLWFLLTMIILTQKPRNRRRGTLNSNFWHLHSFTPLQQCNNLPGQIFVTMQSALDLYSKICWLEPGSRNDGFSQISGILPFPLQVVRKVRHLEWICDYIHISCYILSIVKCTYISATRVQNDSNKFYILIFVRYSGIK